MGVIINNITWWRIKLDDEVPPVSLPLTSSERDGLLASSPEYKTKENSNNYFQILIIFVVMNFGINIWFPGTESWIVAYLNFLLNAFQNQNGMYIS